MSIMSAKQVISEVKGNTYSYPFAFAYAYNVIVGVGVLAFPRVFSQTGLLLGVILLILICITGYITKTYLIEVLAAANAYHKLVAANDNEPPNELNKDNKLLSFRNLLFEMEETEMPQQKPSIIQPYDNENAATIDNKVDDFEIIKNYEIGAMADMFFPRVGVVLCYLAICLQFVGDASIYAVFAATSLTQTVCDLVNYYGKNESYSIIDKCDIEDNETTPLYISECFGGLSKQHFYYIFLGVFYIIFGSLAYFHLTRTKWLQIITNIFRYLGLRIKEQVVDSRKERLQKTIKVPRPPRVTTGTTFSVHDVEKSTKELPSHSSSEEIVFERCGSIVPEAHSTFTYTPFERVGSYKPVCNGFIAAIHTAFSQHYPLVFSPDSIWLCIIQGLASHINANAEKLRQHFVEFEGKKDIPIYPTVPFVKGSPSNPWEEVFELFSQGIRQHIGDKTHTLLTPEFSTTTSVERATSQIVLMDCFKQFFCYQMMCICGIPSVTLEGTVEDWKRLRERALSLRQYDLDWWIDELEPVLDQFVAAASGNVDNDFWISIYKLEWSYGVEYINGWIVTLFPYLKDSVRNEYLDLWKKDSFNGKPDSRSYNADPFNACFGSLTTSSFSSGVVSVPFEWIDVPEQKQYPMQFFAGFMAATQNPDTLAIYPEQGWAVADRNEIDTSSEIKKQHDRPRNRR